MKTILLLLLSSFSLYENKYCEEKVNPKCAKSCLKLDTNTTNENGEKGYKCCFYKMNIEIDDESGEEKKCKLLTQNEYINIKNTIRTYEKMSRKEWNKELEIVDEEDKFELELECYSKYFNLSILALLFILF